MKVIYLKRPGWWLAAVLAAVLVLCLALTLWLEPSAPATAVSGEPLKEKVVLIDPGHGGFDPGAVADDGTHEDELNLKISLYLAQTLCERGATVIMTRMSNEALGGTKREDMAHRLALVSGSGADMILSIHMNHFPSGRYFGTQVFYRTGDEASESLAVLIQETVRSDVDPKNTRLSKSSDNYGILNTAKAPAVLVECGFISNPDERARLKEAAYQKKLAKAIADGVTVFFQEQ